jgi:hypothetical protein
MKLKISQKSLPTYHTSFFALKRCTYSGPRWWFGLFRQKSSSRSRKFFVSLGDEVTLLSANSVTLPTLYFFLFIYWQAPRPYIFYYFSLYTVFVCKFRPQESQSDVLGDLHRMISLVVGSYFGMPPPLTLRKGDGVGRFLRFSKHNFVRKKNHVWDHFKNCLIKCIFF